MTSLTPWLKSSETGSYVPRPSYSRTIYRSPSTDHTVRYIKEYLDDSSAMALRKGDIVQFNSGFIEDLNGWPSWFLTERKDKEKYWPVDKRVPTYARRQYAVVAGRYRKVKFKYNTFADYGVVIMMLTGTNIGHMRHYYGCGNPFELKNSFPEPLGIKKLIRTLPQNIIDIFHTYREDTNEGRNALLSKLNKELNLKGE